MEQASDKKENIGAKREVSDSELISELEALLFVSGEPTETKLLAELTKVDEDKIDTCLRKLAKKLNDDPESGLRLLLASSGVQIVTAEEHGSLVESFLQHGTREQLAPAAAEVLAIVAYRGPIHRAGIEAIRGVNSSFSLRQLSVRGLVDRYPSEKDNRIFLYRISAEFLRHLGIVQIEDLPDFEKFRQHEGMTNLEKSVNPKTGNQDSEKRLEGR